MSLSNRGQDTDPGEITIGTTHAVIRRPHERRRITAAILHREGSLEAPTWVVLDRLVHESYHNAIGDYLISGALSSELRAPEVPPTPTA